MKTCLKLIWLFKLIFPCSGVKISHNDALWPWNHYESVLKFYCWMKTILKLKEKYWWILTQITDLVFSINDSIKLWPLICCLSCFLKRIYILTDKFEVFTYKPGLLIKKTTAWSSLILQLEISSESYKSLTDKYFEAYPNNFNALF